MTLIPHEPAEPAFDDAILAYKRLTAPAMSTRIETDPFGTINRIVRLIETRGGRDRIIKSALCHIPVGATVMLGHDAGYVVRYWNTAWDEIESLRDGHLPCWYITVNDHRVLTATDAECRPPAPPAPKVLWRSRARRRASQWARTRADRLAARLGYRRDDALGDDW
jgi:hypothetical protein